jgi:(4-(4-[2-(gamma-L-glutamylamino)ethyl]phenoxymethyl)furan-2-yl)methanamine synthase
VKGPVLGWDVGGANVKAALVGADSHPEPTVVERPFPLWREPCRLPSVLAEVSERLGGSRSMAVTMTAELADCFNTKREGVAFVLDAFRTAFPGIDPWVYGIDGRFRSTDAARRRPLMVAAANWRAGATLVARTFPDALFLDVGSTTTDLIPIVSGRVATRGKTDPGRLRTGELIYTGALRTPVCAIVRAVPLGSHRCRVAAEHFAITADVYRWLERIDDDEYTCETPDGRGRSRAEAGARLARVVCADLDLLNANMITAIAEHVARMQVRQITGGLRQVMRRLGPACPPLAVLAGQGAFVARAAAEQLGLTVYDLSNEVGRGAARATPAAAVALLLAEIADV